MNLFLHSTTELWTPYLISKIFYEDYVFIYMYIIGFFPNILPITINIVIGDIYHLADYSNEFAKPSDS